MAIKNNKLATPNKAMQLRKILGTINKNINAIASKFTFPCGFIAQTDILKCQLTVLLEYEIPKNIYLPT